MTEATAVKPPSLVRKLANVMGAFDRVAKNGVNQFFKYSYATEADVTSAVRGAMAEQGVMMITTLEKIEWSEVATAQGKKEKLCTASFLFTLLDADSDAKIELRNIGQGQDGGDKAFYKATTGAVKYALLKLFLIPTGDDPENEKAEKAPLPAPAGTEALQKALTNPGTSPTRTHADFKVGSFGPEPTGLLSTLSPASLAYYFNSCLKNLNNPEKAQYHAQETLRRAGYEAEFRFRGLPVPS